MLSSIPSRFFGSSDFQNTEPARYSLRNFQLCPELQNELIHVAVLHTASNLLKALLSVKRSELIDSRNKVDIPFGLFGLSLDNFYLRRGENIVYIDVLKMVCKVTLEQAKICIVLDDLQDLTCRLFDGYRRKNVEPILTEIKKSVDLLTINDTIMRQYRENSETLRKLRDKLNMFDIRERNAIAFMDNEVYNMQNKCVETQLVLEPIEFRYKLSFHNRTIDQFEERLRGAENKLTDKIDYQKWTQDREDTVTECICLKQKLDIDMFKTKLEQMQLQYDRDFENVDGQIQYKINSMDIMRGQRIDCIAKMKFFAIEKVKLIEWLEDWRQKHAKTKKKKKEEAPPQ